MNLTIRNLADDERRTVDSWAAMRGRAMPWGICPPDAYVAEVDGEPKAFVTFTLGLRVPMMWMDWLFSAPGTPLKLARQCFRAALAEAFNRHFPAYQLCRIGGFCGGPLAREARSMGFVLNPTRTEGLYGHG